MCRTYYLVGENMEKIKVSDLQPGMKVQKHIFDRFGKLLLAEGTILKPQHIRKLELYGVEGITIDNNVPVNIEALNMQTTESDVLYQEAFNAIKDVLSKVRNAHSIDTKVIAEVVENIVDKIVKDTQTFLRLSSIRDMDNYTYLHSIDVCIYSIIMGKSLGLDNKNLLKLGLGAILHDIGKGKIPAEILFKPGPLTEEEFDIMKSHTTYGYEIISGNPNLDSTTANIALQHHERWDGRGYPGHLREKGINIFARIVTICDIYDALTANRVYRGRILPHEAAEYIVNNNGIISDPALTKYFVQNVAIYPVGATVLLSTGEIGKVSEIHSSAPLRPVINVFGHRDAQKNVPEHKLNLMEDLTVFIVDVIN